MANQKEIVLAFIRDQLTSGTFYCQIFKSLLDEEIYSDLPPSERDKAKALLLYITHKIISNNQGSLFQKSKLFEPEPISAKTFRKIFGNDYQEYLSFFLEKGIITRTNYEVGNHSYQYNIGEQFLEGEIESKQITHKPTVKNLKKHYLAFFEANKKLYKDFSASIYWYTTGKLQIDVKQANNCLGKLKDRHVLRMAASNVATDDLIHIINKSFPSQMQMGMAYVQNIENNKHKVFIDYKGWRLYSSLTLMMSILRNHITYDGKELCSIDIKNSQPFHLCHMLTEEFWSPQKLAASFQTLYSEDEEKEGYSLFIHLKEQNPSLLKEVRRIVKEQPDDIRKYIELTQSGGFYEYLSESLKKDYPARHKDRTASKQRFMQFLNSDPSKHNTPQYADYRKFKEKFPNVCYIMEAVKRRSYKDMSQVLQRLEAKMLLHYFAKEFTNQCPDIPFFTVHDSIITLTEYKDRATAILENVYLKYFGIKPTTDGGKRLNYQNAMDSVDGYIDDKTVEALKQGNFEMEYFQQLLDKYNN